MCTTELTSKIRELRELQQLIEEATTEAEAIKDTIKAELTARNVDTLDIDVFKIRWVAVKSTRFDTAAFKATHKELHDQYSKTTESKRFTVA